jgi:hypothetical protein
MARDGAGAYHSIMRYVIQYYAPATGGALPDVESVEVDSVALSEAQARAQRDVAPGGACHWAVAYEIMDYDAFGEGKIDDPAVVSWSRHAQAS